MYSEQLKSSYKNNGKDGYLPLIREKLENKYGIPCFFSDNELFMVEDGKTKTDIKKKGEYSHLKFYEQNGELGFLDYSSRPTKFYKNLEDWMTEHNICFNDVYYGYQKFDGKKDYFHLKCIFDSSLQKQTNVQEIEETLNEEDLERSVYSKKTDLSEFINKFGGFTISGNPIFNGNFKFTIRY